MYKLREIERKDLVEINRWRNNIDLINCLGAPFRYINSDVDEKWYESYLANRRNTIRCAIINSEDRIIGLISLVAIDDISRSAELHIMIGKDSDQNSGAGTFAVRTLLQHAFMNLNLNRVELSVLATNKRAIGFYQKIGFVYEGTKRNARFKNGQFVDLLIFSMLKEEFVTL